MNQQVIDRIKANVLKTKDRLVKYNPPTLSIDLLLVDNIEKALLGETIFDDALIQRIISTKTYEVRNLMQNVFFRQFYDAASYPWHNDHSVIKNLIQRKYLSANRYETITDIIYGYVYQHLATIPDLDEKAFIQFLFKQGFSDVDIINICVNMSDVFYHHHSLWIGNLIKQKIAPQPTTLTPFARYLLPLLKPSSGFLGLGKKNEIKKIIDHIIFNQTSNELNRSQWLNFILDHYPDQVDDYNKFLIVPNLDKKERVNIYAVYLLIEKDAARYENDIRQVMQNPYLEAGISFGILLKLNEKLQDKYKLEIESIGEAHLLALSRASQPVSYYEPKVHHTLFTEIYMEYLFQKDFTVAKARLEQFFKDALAINQHFFDYVHTKLGAEALPLFIEALQKSPDHLSKYDLPYYYNQLFKHLEQYQLDSYKQVIINFATIAPTKNTRELACKILSTIQGVIPDAQALLTERTVDQRVTGALILSHLNDEDAKQALNDAVDKEGNDDTRDIMLEALQEKKFAEPFSLLQVQDMIALAAARKKLSKWNEKWLDETKLPALYYKDSGDQLSNEAVRFLLYRMKRAPGLNSDVEARQLLQYIDRSRSQGFAKVLLLAFQDSNADSKLKYYLTLAALLGDDDMMHNLNTLFKKNIADKRVKMAEYVVGALAMVGSDKALRLVEVIYRKFASKKPTVSQAARAALDAAATELNISMDELADRIIPNFDFEGIYKSFQVDGEEYRAFINAEFKLNFLNEDNKVRKSLPANASKELKASFKEIEKEINDVVKSQSGRLEKYMVEERRWTTADWHTFFFNNPIMFVYALKLIWGVFDKEDKLVNTFYCSEDTSLYDVNDEEVVLDETLFVKIIHPCHLTTTQLEQWKDKIYGMSMLTIFPILDRPVFRVEPEEKENSVTKVFFNQNVAKGADFVNTFLPKCNWTKNNSDGGRVEFTKLYKDGAIMAYAHIDGPAVWYQGGTVPAKVYEISFTTKGWREKVALKDLPAVFYSEVCADIHQLINVN